MICDVAVRRTRDNRRDVYTLRVTGKTALGPSGTGGRDGKDFGCTADLLLSLKSLEVPANALRRAEDAIADPTRDGRFTDVANDLQIPFEALEAADIYLFDLS